MSYIYISCAIHCLNKYHGDHSSRFVRKLICVLFFPRSFLPTVQKDKTQPGKPKNNVTIAEPSDVIEPSVAEPSLSVDSVQPVDMALAGKHNSVDLRDAGSPVHELQVKIDGAVHKDKLEPAGHEASNVIVPDALAPSNVTVVDGLVPSNETQVEETSKNAQPQVEVTLPSNETQVEEPNVRVEPHFAKEPVLPHADVAPPTKETPIDEPVKAEPQADKAPALLNATVPENATTSEKEEKTEEAFLDALKPGNGNATDEMPLAAQTSAGITNVDPVTTKTAASSKRHNLEDNVEQDLAALHEAPASPQSNAPPVEQVEHHEPHHDKALDAIDSIEQKVKKHESNEVKLPGPSNSSDEMPEEPSLKEDRPARLDTSPMRRPRILIRPRPRPILIRPNTNFCPPCRK